ncbi:ABC transporter substrate-binding protein [Paenibacillus sp. HW567]|uniref:ABC transporter substrate-binding protein n=1 Tax=Paenibacillus sp. HW567 TaxID=1034769 RepID=UPI0003A9DD9B|nr:extracellular solute-binding protein [Paenibacillus sp. HW567]
MSTKRNYRRTALFLITVMCLTGCSRGSSDSGGAAPSIPEPVTLSFIYEGGDSVANQALQEVVDSFNDSHPGIRINGISSEAGAGSYQQFLLKKNAVGEFPDMLEMKDTELYVKANLLSPIPQEITGLLEAPAELAGQVYTAPMSRSLPLAIVYNRDVFAKAGITAEPANWAEFLRICAKIKAAGISPIVVGGKDARHLAYWSDYFFGANVYADRPDWNADKSSGTASFMDKNAASAVKDMQELWNRGYVNPSWLYTDDSETAAQLALGKAGMLYTGVWALEAIKQANPGTNIGVFAPPDRQGRTVVRESSPLRGFALSAEAAGEPGKLAAFTDFLHYFYDPVQYARYLEVVKGLPATKEQVTYPSEDATGAFIAIADNPHTVKVLAMNDYWGEKVMPDGFRDWFLGLLQYTLAQNRPNAAQLMQQADEQWSQRRVSFP